MSGEERIDYLVVGAGPAGIQAGYFLERAGRDYLVVEEGAAPGTFFTRFPRHRTLISINKVHTGWDDPELRLRTDWNSLLSDERGPLFTAVTPAISPPPTTWSATSRTSPPPTGCASATTPASPTSAVPRTCTGTSWPRPPTAPRCGRSA